MTRQARPAINIGFAEADADIDRVRELFLEYAGSLDFNLCFQDFDAELATLPGQYSAPRGCLLLARVGRDVAGCIGIRPLNAQEAEMKRLYVRPDYRGRSIGRRLAERGIDFARCADYAVLRLDTVSAKMRKADAMYRKMGFEQTAAYYDNPIAGAAYYALPLR